MYHRIADPGSAHMFWPGLISTTPAEFERQMRVLSGLYRFISVDELLEVRRGERPAAERSLLLTFDEGYADFHEHAWPVLKRYGIPATMFVATAFPDSAEAFWWDELYHALWASRRRDPVRTRDGIFHCATARDRRATLRAVHALVAGLPHATAMRLVKEVVDQLDVPPLEGDVLPWATLRSLVDAGVTVAAHTHSHPRLTHVDAESLERELRVCQDVLGQQLGAAPPVIAYPAGDQNREVIAAARRTGFEIGFSTRRGVNRLGQADWMRLDRINVGTASTVPLIRAQLALLPPSLSD
jgi:peptidoglycan/xylan/chitin deacetylase (PgdA/CDA1 family)